MSVFVSINFYNIDNVDFAAGLSKEESLSSAFRTRFMTIQINLQISHIISEAITK
jgi:hypothetical protein